MSKPINLLSLSQAKINLSSSVFEKFKQHNCIKFRSDEMDDLVSLVNRLTSGGCSISEFENFVVGYQIPQIGKEFDLLRFGGSSVINIELKKTSSKEKVKKQLTQNSYYLSFAKLKTYHYTYISDSKILFKLSSSGEIERVEITELVTLLKKQASSQKYDIDELFHPANYLVSPFNSTERFLAGEYFLTQQQEVIFDIMIKHLFVSTISGFISLTGGAGTGKTLLAYHVAKKALEGGKKVLIIHCGILNLGHLQLISKGWKIQSIREYKSCVVSDYDLVIIDEAQRLLKYQFEYLSQKIKSCKALCIFSFDQQQTLADFKNLLDTESQISSLDPISSHSLTDKIRSNKEIADFITMLFNKNRNFESKLSENIILKYFSTNENACDYLDSLDKKEWQFLNFTPSQYDTEHHKAYFKKDIPTSHRVIGQEFNNVTIVIDELFSYHVSGQLIYQGTSYYNPRKMLFQNITRARRKILIVIINNEEILERCMSILNNQNHATTSNETINRTV